MEATLDQMRNVVGAYVPNLLGALAILVIGWLVAWIIAAIFNAALRRTELDNRLARWIAGEESVGIGTDFTQDQDQAFFDWLTHDKGYARKLVHFEPIKNPQGIRTIGEFPNLTRTMKTAGWPDRRIQRVMGENWLRVLKEVWGE